MKTYQVTIERDGEWWLVRVPAINRVTQANQLETVEAMARDLIAVVEDVHGQSFDVEIATRNSLDDIMSLAEAADELGLGQSTLRAQVKARHLVARNVGKTWITTRDEVERYRRNHLGKIGRPRGS
jgi:hypothetical protein